MNIINDDERNIDFAMYADHASCIIAYVEMANRDNDSFDDMRYEIDMNFNDEYTCNVIDVYDGTSHMLYVFH